MGHFVRVCCRLRTCGASRQSGAWIERFDSGLRRRLLTYARDQPKPPASARRTALSQTKIAFQPRRELIGTNLSDGPITLIIREGSALEKAMRGYLARTTQTA